MMKLYFADTSNARKACAIARHLGSPVEFVRIDLAKGEHKTPEYLTAINPNGKVPALVDGDRRIWESNAILCYLAQQAGSDLWPADPDGQMEVVRWLSWDGQHFSRHGGTLYFEHIIKARFGIGEPDPAAVQQALGFWRGFAEVLSGHLADNRYLLGDRLTIADFAAGIYLPYAEKAKLPLGDYPVLQRWHDRLNALPAWREPFPA